ncbi:MAG: carbohydrate ABC transporter permease [bacterium]|nr:sugar ABC transporter permease [Phycisphaerales bacterium]MCE2653294.1 sugar ABC transporter permease [Planctomycetaceae bacterium]
MTPALPASGPLGPQASAAAPRRRSLSGPALAAWLLLAPWLILFALFVLWPLGEAARLAVLQTFGPSATNFVGGRNFSALFADPLFWIAVRNTAIYAATSVLIQLPLALGLAMLLNRPDVRARAAFRLIFFSPSLVGVVYVAMIFGIMFEKRTGLINRALHSTIGWDLEYPWLQNAIMAALVIASLWQWVGFNMVYFLAALQNVRQDLMEAARIDGAGPWARFRLVTLPAIRPVAGFVVLLSVIGSFQLFELPYLMLNSSAGPENRGLTIVMYLYQTGFEIGDLGYASAIGWVLAVLLVVCAVAQRLLSRGEEDAA